MFCTGIRKEDIVEWLLVERKLESLFQYCVCTVCFPELLRSRVASLNINFTVQQLSLSHAGTYQARIKPEHQVNRNSERHEKAVL